MQIYSDLVLEAKELIDEKRASQMEAAHQLPEGVIADTEEQDEYRVTRIRIESDEAAEQLGKSQGNYITIELKTEEISSLALQQQIAHTLSAEMNLFTGALNKEDPCIMVVGLGNRSVTPDSLGPRVVDRMVVTKHLKSNEQLRKHLDTRMGTVCAVAPGVMGITGIETGAILQGLINVAHPDLVIAVDALASRKTSRVNTTIQISDTGIVPGSGVGNRRMELSQNTLGIPVIAIGVPTVVDALTMTCDLLEKATGKAPDDTMLERLSDTYGSEMIVTPKNIDVAIERMCIAISNGLNMALHKGFDTMDVHEYLM